MRHPLIACVPRPLRPLLAPLMLGIGVTALSGCNALKAFDPAEAPDPDQLVVGGAVAPEDTAADVATDAVPTATAADRDIEIAEAAVAADDLWARIRAELAMRPGDDPQIQQRIEAQMRWFIDNPGYLQRVSARAEPFLYLIVEEIEQRRMPIELALLPIVESGFQPFAYSHGRAAGLWQFIPSTGEHFGLKQNWWYDGRRDVHAATHAALDYLSQLATQFDGDWLLALASYNAGAGTVRRAIARNERAGRPTDFWHLNLPRETTNYVPRLLAVSRLIADPEAFGIALTEIPNEPQLARIDIGSQIDLARAAELAGMSLDELHLLNPAFNRWATDPDGPHQLLLPPDNAARLQAGLDNLPHDERIEWHRHVIRSGDTLSVLASRYGTTTDTLKSINGLHNSRIRVGDALLIPTASQPLGAYTLSADQRLATTQNRERGGTRVDHTVRNGDTLWKLARQYRVSTRQIAKWNGMAPGDTLQVGRSLVIWTHRRSAATVDAPETLKVATQDPLVRTVSYQVRKGDSLYEIARKFRVSVDDLRRWNAKTLGEYLQPGQRLTVHVDLTRQGSA